jgi:3-oxoacyl-[acyl-carrier-protein] synthase II
MLLGVGPDGPVPGRRVAITGIGVVSCCGVGTDALWTGLNGPAPEGERRAKDFDPEQWVSAKEARQLDRFAQFAVAVADMALADAGELGADPGRSGVVMGTGVGGLETLEQQILIFGEKGARRVSPRLVPMMMSNAGAAAVSIRLGWHGPSETITTACAAGAHSIGHAARLVASGRCDVAIGGAAEAGMTGVGIAAFSNMTALSTSGNSRPFDIRRDGFVITEGAGALVLEAWDRAVARGARIYGELAGSASTADAHHITAPIPGGSGAAACMTLAMEDATVAPGQIGHINAHGTSTPLNDRAESDAITKVFDGSAPPVTSTKGITGHGLGACGAIEAVAVLLSMEHRLIPPTAGYEQPDPDIHLDVVADVARPWDPAPVLSNSFGFGGHNGCLVISPA